MRLALALCALLSLLPLQQPDFAYGKPEDLKGLHKVFVNTGDDTKSRDQISKALKESKLGFELLDSEEDAEIVLLAASPKPKLVMSFNFTQETAFQHKPVTNFITSFLKAYRKANG